jgi:hypothetical protein
MDRPDSLGRPAQRDSLIPGSAGSVPTSGTSPSVRHIRMMRRQATIANTAVTARCPWAAKEVLDGKYFRRMTVACNLWYRRYPK